MLDLIWSAYFDDKTILDQYYNNEANIVTERLFIEVQEKQKKSKLIRFVLSNTGRGAYYLVNLEQGRIYLNSHNSKNPSKPEIEVSGNPKYDYRLIYFRRVTRHITWAGEQMTDKGIQDIQYFLGFQYTNENNENVKRLLQISKDDEVYFA